LLLAFELDYHLVPHNDDLVPLDPDWMCEADQSLPAAPY
jgi:hypothetical protein